MRQVIIFINVNHNHRNILILFFIKDKFKRNVDFYEDKNDKCKMCF